MERAEPVEEGRRSEEEERTGDITTEDVKKHYQRPEVKDIILDWSNIDEPKKAQRALVASHRGWYQYRENKNGEAPQEKALVPATEGGYDKQIKRMERQGDRSLYHSLNYFDPPVFREWVHHWPDEDKDEESPGGYKETVFYGLGTDIDLKDEDKVEDLDRDRTVTNAEDREWLEKAIKFHVDWLTDHGISGKIIKPYFSGNGAYITLDPSVIKLDCEPQKAEEICRGYNHVIKQIEKEFFEENPKAKDYIQFDALNNSKRQWKTPLSIHKSKPFACIPIIMSYNSVLDPVIELEKAKLPLSDTVIDLANQWIHDRPSVDERDRYAEQVGNYSRNRF